MILEGLPTFVLGIATWWLLADDPRTAYYLTPAEKALMIERRKREIGYTESGTESSKDDVWKALLDWKIYIFAFGQFGADTMLYGFSTFLPTIIKGLGKWSTTQTQALTVPCYALGAITYLAIAWLSDKQQKRGLYAVSFGALSVVGYGILISDSSSGVHFFGCFLVAMGLYIVTGIPLSWLPTSRCRASSPPTPHERVNAESSDRSTTVWQAYDGNRHTAHHRELQWYNGAFRKW